ncbi:hypothetical protein DENIS_2895 [Desulfonema ishimotonii]|uniref:Uncharacterized protein n=1 Tax=Desulfonema ishimotonii TaxID=45657 RepID=A0A401FYB3_9BACT|nr:hypothetical protein DENIS_2895 [Desulfonema ishimotonii]
MNRDWNPHWNAKKREASPDMKKIDGEKEARLITPACSQPIPDGPCGCLLTKQWKWK